ncbi:MAG: DUF3825 domain-containing protein [Cyanobacteria bacterium J06643_4]
MPSLFSALARFLQRLFRLGTQPEKALASRNSARNEASTYPREIVNRRSRTPAKVAAPAKKSPHKSSLNGGNAPAQVPVSLRRVLTLATYAMPKPRMHAGQFGSLLRQQDADFSYQKYGFTKLIYLLEAVPELVSLDRVNHPGAAPAYYVRDASRLKQIIAEATKAHPSEDGWVHIETVKDAAVRAFRGGALPSRQSDEFFLFTYGFATFRELLESLPMLIEFKQNNPDYLRLLSSFNFRKQTAKPILYPQRDSQRDNQRDSPRDNQRDNQKNSHKNSTATTGDLSRRPSLAPSSGINSRQVSQLSQFVGLSPEKLNQTVSELAAIALPERWYFGPQPPENFPYPILKSYLRYTFIRLQHEQKLFSASSGQPYKAFNTGLLDRLLRPIYALLTPLPTDPPSKRTSWEMSFCIPGEGIAGKALATYFPTLPPAANYLTDPSRAFYHLDAGYPEVDWPHIIKDNMERLPQAFIDQFAPANFTARDTDTLIGKHFHTYKKSFADALDADPQAYRRIVNRLEEALGRTLLKTQANYKIPVPTYYPNINSIDLLLPICLVTENIADCALVVRRTEAGKYIGHTILTMRQAYNNARLICKLDEHWLTRAMTLSQADAEDALGDSEID